MKDVTTTAVSEKGLIYLLLYTEDIRNAFLPLHIHLQSAGQAWAGSKLGGGGSWEPGMNSLQYTDNFTNLSTHEHPDRPVPHFSPQSPW
jgi:hypothetical protein